MEPEARYTLVGTSVLVLLAALVAAVAWLAASGRGNDTRSYKIYFAHQSLEGLQVRSDVRMRGIRVGAVSRFAFSSQRPGTVEVIVEVDPSTPVKESTRAVVERNLITGLATIRLQNITEDSPALTRAESGEPDPVIAEGASQLQQFSETVNELAQRADETLGRINTTLSAANQAAIGETLDNLRVITHDARGIMKRVDGTLATIGGTADRVGVATVALSGDVHRLVERYDALGAETTTSLHDVTGAVRQMSSDVSTLTKRTEDVLTDSDVEIRLTAQQLRSTADALGVAARKLRDPRSSLFGPAEGSYGPGEEHR